MRKKTVFPLRTNRYTWTNLLCCPECGREKLVRLKDDRMIEVRARSEMYFLMKRAMQYVYARVYDLIWQGKWLEKIW